MPDIEGCEYSHINVDPEEKPDLSVTYIFLSS